jgi:hypothetical protein
VNVQSEKKTISTTFIINSRTFLGKAFSKSPHCKVNKPKKVIRMRELYDKHDTWKKGINKRVVKLIEKGTSEQQLF